MKKGLVLGAIAPFCDLVKEMETLDISPIVCDYYVDAPAKKMGYPSYDISTTDFDEVLKLAKEYEVDGIVSAFSDRNLEITYRVAEELNLPQLYNMEIIDLVTDKLTMKDFFEKIGLPVIKYRILDRDFADADIDGIDFPVVTKPIDAYGSKGIFVCNTIDEIRTMFDKTTAEAEKYKDKIIIEEFYPVDEISVTGWVKDGEVYITCIYDVIKNYEPSIELATVAFPSKYTNANLEQIKEIYNKTVKACGIQEGPVTLQCFIGDKGIKVSELLFRLAGNSPYLYGTYIGGPNIAQMLLQYYIGEEINYQDLESFKPLENGEMYYDIQIFAMDKGKITYQFDEESIKELIPECIDARLYHVSGDELINVPSTGKMYMRLICKVPSYKKEDYYALLDKIREHVQLINEEGKNVCGVRSANNINQTVAVDINWDFLK